MTHLITLDLTEETPAARGRQHGTALSAEIAAMYDRYVRLGLMVERGTADERRLLDVAMRYWPQMSAWSPELAEELTGIAEGAGLRLEQVLLLNLYDEIGLTGEHDAVTAKCSGLAVSAAASASGSAMIGQNLDISRWYLPCVLFRIAPSAGETGKLMVSQPGIVGGPGTNDSVAMTWVTTIPKDSRFGIPGPFLIRRALQETDLDAAIDVVTSAPRAMGSHLNFADAERAFVYEGSAERHVLKQVKTVAGNANNYDEPELLALEHMADADPTIFAASCHRGARLSRLLRDAAAAGKISREQLQRMLADHDGFPFSVCEHEQQGNVFETLVSIVFEPAGGRIWYAPGTPCSTPFASAQVPVRAEAGA